MPITLKNISAASVPTPPVTKDTIFTDSDVLYIKNSAGVVTPFGSSSSTSVVTANGFAGTVATPTTTPAITLTTTVTGILLGNGTAVAAATNADLPAMSATVGGAVPTPPNNTITFLRGDGTFNGAVTSVAATVPTFLSVAGSPITTNGTLAITLSGTALPAINGGTDQIGYTIGDTLYASTTSTLSRLAIGADGQVLTLAAGIPSWATPTVGTVTSASVVTANGVSGSVATATTTPAITLTLGAITPSSVASTGAVTGTNLSGTNTGDAPNYQEFVATAAQTIFNTTINTTAKAGSKSYLMIFVTGVFQQEGAALAYTVTGANQVTFNAGVALNANVVMYSYS